MTDGAKPATGDSRRLAVTAARSAASKQAEAVSVLDVRDLITITDYFVICSGSSERQVDTIADEVVKELKGIGVRPVRRRARREPAGNWWTSSTSSSTCSTRKRASTTGSTTCGRTRRSWIGNAKLPR